MPDDPTRSPIAPDFSISKIITGLWQIADMEKDGQVLDPDSMAAAMLPYRERQFTTFDMADHYGSAEIISGHLLKRYKDAPDRPIICTKWCPEPGEMSAIRLSTRSFRSCRCSVTPPRRPSGISRQGW